MVALTGDGHDTDEFARPESDASAPDDLVIVDNREAGAYELSTGGQTVAGLLYSETDRRVTLLATSVFREFRGRGLAGTLLGEVLTRLRAEGRTATVTCPFATAFVHAHPEYSDVIDPDRPGAVLRPGRDPAQ